MWHKISSMTSSFAKCKLIWILCRPQKYLTTGYFNCMEVKSNEVDALYLQFIWKCFMWSNGSSEDDLDQTYTVPQRIKPTGAIALNSVSFSIFWYLSSSFLSNQDAKLDMHIQEQSELVNSKHTQRHRQEDSSNLIIIQCIRCGTFWSKHAT